MKTNLEIKLKAIGIFSLFKYLNEFNVKCTISALAISPAITSISLSKAYKLNGILNILKMWVVIIHDAGVPPPE